MTEIFQGDEEETFGHRDENWEMGNLKGVDGAELVKGRVCCSLVKKPSIRDPDSSCFAGQ